MGMSKNLVRNDIERAFRWNPQFLCCLDRSTWISYDQNSFISSIEVYILEREPNCQFQIPPISIGSLSSYFPWS